MDFAESRFARFSASGAGRGLRIVTGIGLIAAGLAWIGGVWRWAMAAIGLVPLGAGLFDVCILSPRFGGSFRGSALRRGHGHDH